ncbi:hypothetical protein M433DRAFT_419888 [Acidomyces richmondensis BFW]|nr:MAG: hypothetical protein FE78DRAFT_341322 [Acidomyces sp. 'richmondensis']KYG42298.1 hypothetical protein M433DRAFT_419888 [Acidomyces richmondensis BFW]
MTGSSAICYFIRLSCLDRSESEASSKAKSNAVYKPSPRLVHTASPISTILYCPKSDRVTWSCRSQNRHELSKWLVPQSLSCSAVKTHARRGRLRLLLPTTFSRKYLLSSSMLALYTKKILIGPDTARKQDSMTSGVRYTWIHGILQCRRSRPTLAVGFVDPSKPRSGTGRTAGFAQT